MGLAKYRQGMDMEGRNAKGQFIKGHRLSVGNKGGPGRAPRSVEERYFETLRQAISQEDWDAATRAVLQEAKKGNVSAYKMLADRLVGAVTTKLEAKVDVRETLNEDLEQSLGRILGPTVSDGDASSTD